MGCISKLTLFVLNFAIFVAGVAVVALASMVIHKDNTYGALLGEGTFTLPVIILIAGLTIVVIGFLGCCGAMKESSCMLKTYACIVIVMLLAELALGIVVLVYPAAAENTIKKGMVKVFEKYGRDDATNVTIDAIQHDLHCCGVENYTDWQNYPYGETGNVSRGCCREDDGNDQCFLDKNQLSADMAKKEIYIKGCFAALKSEFMGETVALGVVLFIMAIVQVLAATCACRLAKNTGSSHYA
ncbi:Tetraspanin-7 [Chionoecetes opilio]|uniref:Tetraspanin n=1 Tax=Chionoecetes opilio TaxID=41210 RepID=A0A8J4XPG9_CHIOP|nr:Tetraspanin-7 [Chionoecetes opilio]